MQYCGYLYTLHIRERQYIHKANTNVLRCTTSYKLLHWTIHYSISRSIPLRNFASVLAMYIYTVITFISSGNKWYFVGIWPHIYCATHTINLFLCCKIVAKANIGTKKVKKGTLGSPFFVLLLITRYHLCFL